MALVVAACFIREQQEKNGTMEVPNDEGGTDIATVYSNGESILTIYPGPLRLSLSEVLEQIMIETFGNDYWADFTIKTYIDFLDISVEHGPRLSERDAKVCAFFMMVISASWKLMAVFLQCPPCTKDGENENRIYLKRQHSQGGDPFLHHRTPETEPPG